MKAYSFIGAPEVDVNEVPHKPLVSTPPTGVFRARLYQPAGQDRACATSACELQRAGQYYPKQCGRSDDVAHQHFCWIMPTRTQPSSEPDLLVE